MLSDWSQQGLKFTKRRDNSSIQERRCLIQRLWQSSSQTIRTHHSHSTIAMPNSSSACMYLYSSVQACRPYTRSPWLTWWYNTRWTDLWQSTSTLSHLSLASTCPSSLSACWNSEASCTSPSPIGCFQAPRSSEIRSPRSLIRETSSEQSTLCSLPSWKPTLLIRRL